MKNIHFIFTLFIFVTASLFGQQASKEELAEKLLKLTKVDRLMDIVFEQIKTTTCKKPGGGDFNDEQKALYQEFSNKLWTLLGSTMSWDKIKNDYISIYSEVFTEEELSGLIAFYNSPLGQKTLENMPILMNKGMEIGMKKIRVIQPQIQELEKEYIQKIVDKADITN